MLSLDDIRWKDLHGGYKVPYDASIALRSLQNGVDVWDELWSELHHQGDVGVASYAAVPQLVDIAGASMSRDWNFYGLIAVIEVERHRQGNPPLPAWLEPSYVEAWKQAFRIAVTDLSADPDSITTRSILGVLALAKGELKLGAMITSLDSSEIDEWLDDHWAWAETHVQ